MSDLVSGLRPAKRPCSSCPYRKDVPSGVWAEHEYRKLPEYDLPAWAQPVGVFMCHQNDGRLCAGWLGCHDPHHLISLRMGFESIDPSAFKYQSPDPLFATGKEAMRHGLREIEAPGKRAVRVIQKLARRLGIG